jgi:hypothetical protein
VDQQTPLAVIAPPPSLEIVPPEVAVVCVIELAAVVELIDGKEGGEVVNVTELPYPVPAEFVA